MKRPEWRKCLLILLLLLKAGPAAGDDLRLFGEMSQQEFRALSEDLSAIASHRILSSAQPVASGRIRTDVQFSQTRLANPDAWEAATGSSRRAVAAARLGITLGLPADLELAGFHAQMPGSNVRKSGLELRRVLHDGAGQGFSVQLRGGLSVLGGVEDFDFRTRQADLLLSRPLGDFNAYFAVGRIWTRSEHEGEHQLLPAGLDTERFAQYRGVVGLWRAFGPFELGGEYTRLGSTDNLALRAALRF